MKRYAFFILVLCSTSLAMAQGGHLHDIVIDQQGNAIGGAQVLVCVGTVPKNQTTPCTPLATLYQDLALTTPQTQPIFTDAAGNFDFYAAPGDYSVQISGLTFTTYVLTDDLVPTVGGCSQNMSGAVTCAASGTNQNVYITPSGTGQSIITNALINIAAVGTLNGVVDVKSFSGADIGAQFNTAVAALPASGGLATITEPGTYSYSTPMLIGTVSKLVTLFCAPGVVLNYTGTTGAALTLDAGESSFANHPLNWGVVGCQFTGPGRSSTTVGVQIGSTNGAEGAQVVNVRVGETSDVTKGFGTAVAIGPYTFDISLSNDSLGGDGRGLDDSSNGCSENCVLDNVKFTAANNTDIANYIKLTAFSDWTITAGHQDDAQIVCGGAGRVSEFGTHHENPGNSVTDYSMLVNDGCMFTSVGDSFANSGTGITTSFMSASAGKTTVIAPFTSSASPVTALMALSSGACFVHQTSGDLTGVTAISSGSTTCDGGGTVTLNGGIYTLRNVSLIPHTLANTISCSSSYEGAIAEITDSDSNAWGDVVAHTSGSDKVLAHCNGTNWTVMGK